MIKARGTNNSDGNKRSRSATSDLANRIAEAKGGRPGAENHSADGGSKAMSGHSRAARLGTEFIAAILVGAGIGYVADQALGTSPWVMLVMLLVGFASGVLNVIRAVTEMNRANPAPLDADLGPVEDDEDD